MLKNELILGNCLEILPTLDIDWSQTIMISDPPYNVGYHYSTYKDNLKEKDYLEMLSKVFEYTENKVIIHYPEMSYKFAIQIGQAPQKVVSWVYNSNTAKQSRHISFYGVKPDFRRVIQPYKNPNDKRIKVRIERGILGGRLYDWWNINQVKNVSKSDIDHPCIIPLAVMSNIIGILPEEYTIVDPFMGSGTTGIACKNLNRNFIGIEMDEKYYELSKKRLEI